MQHNINSYIAKYMKITEGCKEIKNRKRNLASERLSARARDFTQPIAYIYTHLSLCSPHLPNQFAAGNTH